MSGISIYYNIQYCGYCTDEYTFGNHQQQPLSEYVARDGTEMFEPPAVKTFPLITVVNNSEIATKVETIIFITPPKELTKYTTCIYKFVNIDSMLSLWNLERDF